MERCHKLFLGCILSDRLGINQQQRPTMEPREKFKICETIEVQPSKPNISTIKASGFYIGDGYNVCLTYRNIL